MTHYLHHSRTLRDMTWRNRLRIILFAFPVLTALAAAGFAVESGLYLLRSERIEARVVERYDRVGETPFDRGVMNYEPIFSFADGATQRRASVGSAHSSFDVAVGDTATIRHIPGDNGNVRMDTWQGLWFMPVVLGVIAAASLLVAGLLWVVLNLLFFRKGDTT